MMECDSNSAKEHSSTSAQLPNFHEESSQAVSSTQGVRSMECYYPFIQPSYINLLPSSSTNSASSTTSSKDNNTAVQAKDEEIKPKEEFKDSCKGEPKIIDQDNIADILLLLGSSKSASELKAHSESNAQHRDAGRMPSNSVSKPPLSISTPKEHNSGTLRPTEQQQSPIEEYEDTNELSDCEEDEEYSVEEDELMEDIEDDEWIETFRISSQFTRKISSTGVIKRKKAPSGSACEKHKRWKKRCPEDCPLRKAKWRFSSQNAYRPVRVPKEHATVNVLKKEDVEQVIALINSSRTDQWEIAAPKLQTVLRTLEKCVSLSRSISSISSSVVQQRADYILLIRYLLKNLLLDTKETEMINYVDEIEKKALCNEITPPLNEETIQQLLSRCGSFESFSRRHKRRPEGSTVHTEDEEDHHVDKKRKKDDKKKAHEKILTIACEKHTIMHARCPPQCPDRRPAKDRPPRGRKPKHLKLQNMSVLNAAPTNNSSSSTTYAPSTTSSSSSSSVESIPASSSERFLKETRITSRVTLEESSSRWRPQHNIIKNLNDMNCNDVGFVVNDSDVPNSDNSIAPDADTDEDTPSTRSQLMSAFSTALTQHVVCDDDDSSDTDVELAPKLINRNSSAFPYIDFDSMYSTNGLSPKKPKQNMFRSAARRYLPKACDKHKLMHAKCPASCPERLARDEMLKL